jgi:hypothetical protein
VSKDNGEVALSFLGRTGLGRITLLSAAMVNADLAGLI